MVSVLIVAWFVYATLSGFYGAIGRVPVVTVVAYTPSVGFMSVLSCSKFSTTSYMI